ncbi:MAG: biotin-dependent carboxyltransferase family protein [Balneolaceae bacterium]
MKGSLKILDGGLFTTIQDSGRTGYRKYGIPVSGVMDSHSYKLANWLAGNSVSAPVLEMTLKGGTCRFLSEAAVGITGADMNAMLNDQPVEINKSINANKGDELTFGYAKSGCRTYLAIHGSWKIDKVMDSCSTYTTAKFGGMKGRKLQKEDVLEWEYEPLSKVEKQVPQSLIPYYSSSGNRIRVIAGPEWERLSKANQERLLETEFKISPQSNRMGIRLKNQTPFDAEVSGLLSSAVVPGIIQLPAPGSPIILMQDGQTAGGYPRIAKVIDIDLWRMAQLAPHATISFNMIDIEEAKKLSKYQASLYEVLE